MKPHSTISSSSAWYALFSRGARDWLRHNQKIRESLEQQLPELISGSDLMTGPQSRTLQLPVQLLEHARFRLCEPHQEVSQHVGQGQGKPGDVFRPAPSLTEGAESGGQAEGEMRLLLDLNTDDMVDWLWDKLKLPDLVAKPRAVIDEAALVREGWDRTGARARLDRRRTLKEAIKRRAIQAHPLPFTNEDLRYRQLVMRPRPASQAVLLFALDVSASMTQAERKLAKTFFFFALQGLRRQYGKVETRFIAHTTQAWEFSEAEFFQVTGSGGTGASTAFDLALQMICRDYEPSRYNAYLFYASDGENFTEDRPAAGAALRKLAQLLNFIGYVETVPGTLRLTDTEMRSLCKQLEAEGAPLESFVLHQVEDIWNAIRHFLMRDSIAAEPI